MNSRDRTLIIAEAGVNHNGDLALARNLVDAAVAAGADAVKFQVFKAEEVATARAPRASYQRVNMPGRDETQLEMIKRLELGFAAFRELQAYCNQQGIMFLASPFDLASVDFLDELAVPYLKVPSSEIVNYPYLRRVGRTGRPLLLSTGMATLAEVEWALGVLRQAGNGEVTLLHCTTNYPAPYPEVNLRAMLAMKEAFGLAVGYSDHTEGILVPVAAVALGAVVIEKHLTLCRRLEGPDHKASLEPDEFKAMVAGIRQVEQCLGDGVKRPAASELEIMPVTRRSLVAVRNIAAGERLGEEALAARRPGTGISPRFWSEVIGREAICPIPAGTILAWEMLAGDRLG